MRHETAIEADESRTTAPADAGRAGSAVGGLLRATREQHGLSVKDVARALRIRAPYIEAIEAGRLADLPAPAYAVGFVKAYAHALGLDENEILRRYRAEAEGLPRRTELSFPAPVPERGVPAGAVALVGIVLAGAIYAGWWYASGGGKLAEVTPAPPERLAAAVATRVAPPPIVLPPPAEGAGPGLVAEPGTAARPLAGLPQVAAAPGAPATIIPPVQSPPPPPAAVAAASEQAGPASAQAAVPPLPLAAATSPDGALPEGVFGAAGNEESRILVRARADTWIQVRDRAAGTVLFNRTLKPGETYRAPLKPGLLLTMGNAPGTDVLLDGQVLANPFPTTAVRRDIPLEPDRVRESLAAPPSAARAPATPAAPTGAGGAAGSGGWTWGTGAASN